MSFPLSRRIVQAAFIVAAGAVPAVMTGVASAAPSLPAVPDLGGLSQVDAGALGGQLQGATHQAGQLTGSSASRAVASMVPSLADASGGAAAKALPEANGMLGTTAGQLAQVAGSTSAATGGLAGSAGGATRAMPVAEGTNAQPTTGSVTSSDAAPAAAAAPASPLSSLPLNSLPVNTSALPLGDAQSTLGGVTGAAAPAQRLGGLPGLGGSGLGDLTHVLPLSGLGG